VLRTSLKNVHIIDTLFWYLRFHSEEYGTQNYFLKILIFNQLGHYAKGFGAVQHKHYFITSEPFHVLSSKSEAQI
jgi:hypothetical protein